MMASAVTVTPFDVALRAEGAPYLVHDLGLGRRAAEQVVHDVAHAHERAGGVRAPGQAPCRPA